MLSMIKYSEIFYSLQGEGRFVGVPSIFLRFFGCNLSCPGFGLTAENPGYDLKEIQDGYLKNRFDNIKNLTEAKIPRFGCDSALSWHPYFKHLAKTKNVEDIVLEMLKLLPSQSFNTTIGNDIHLVLTGGEPLLWQKNIIELICFPRIYTLKNLTIETNGTQEPSAVLLDTLYRSKIQITWSVSPKLSNSGEKRENAIKPSALWSMSCLEGSFLYLKFVVRSLQNFEEAKEIVNEYKKEGVVINAVYVMPEGAVEEQMNEGDAPMHIANDCLKYGFYYSPRLHIDLWGNKWGT